MFGGIFYFLVFCYSIYFHSIYVIKSCAFQRESNPRETTILSFKKYTGHREITEENERQPKTTQDNTTQQNLLCFVLKIKLKPSLLKELNVSVVQWLNPKEPFMTSAPSLQLNTSKACLDRPTVAILPEREGKIIVILLVYLTF